MGQRPAPLPTDPLHKYLRDRLTLIQQGKARNIFVPEAEGQAPPRVENPPQPKPKRGLRP